MGAGERGKSARERDVDGLERRPADPGGPAPARPDLRDHRMVRSGRGARPRLRALSRCSGACVTQRKAAWTSSWIRE